MTSIRKLKIAADAGEPDSVLALRIDVVQAAVVWYDTLNEWNTGLLESAEDKLEVAVRKYKAALKKRNL